jgi:phosphate transport system substrate-binding protein
MWHGGEKGRQGESTLSPLPLLLLLAAGISGWLVACVSVATPTPTSPPVALRVGFDELVRPLAEAVVPIFGDETPEVVVETEIGHADDLLESLHAAQLDALFVPGEHWDKGELWTSVVALDGIALIANRDNPVMGLALSQVQSVFQGQFWSWQAVGGAPAEIEVVTPAEGLAAWDLFQEMVMQENRITLTAVVLPDPETVMEYVASHPWAVGYVGAAAVDDRVKVLAVDGLFPTPDTLADHSYLLHFPIYLVMERDPSGTARRLPAWLMSRDGQAVIGRSYGRVR